MAYCVVPEMLKLRCHILIDFVLPKGTDRPIRLVQAAGRLIIRITMFNV